MIILKDNQRLSKSQREKFKQTLIEMYGKKKRSKKSNNKCGKKKFGKTPVFKIAKAYKNLGY